MGRLLEITGHDLGAIRPALCVDPCDRVKRGDVLFVDRRRPRIAFVTPEAGVVQSVDIGSRRMLDRIVIRIEGEAVRQFELLPQETSPTALRALLLESGLWTDGWIEGTACQARCAQRFGGHRTATGARRSSGASKPACWHEWADGNAVPLPCAGSAGHGGPCRRRRSRPLAHRRLLWRAHLRRQARLRNMRTGESVVTRRSRIADYMARSLVTLPPQLEINRAMVILLDTRISGATVLDPAGRLVGVLSKKDCLRAALNSSYHREWGGLVADYMTREVETLDADLNLVQAAERFLTSHHRRISS